MRIWSEHRLLDDRFLRVDDFRISYTLPSGAMTSPQRRLNVDRGNSVAAILHDQAENLLYFVRQFRFSTYTVEEEPSPENGWLLELIAGAIAAHETQQESILREIEEETGFVSVRHCELIGSFYLTPGASSERLFLFYVAVSGKDRIEARPGGELRGAEDEQIETIALRPAAFLEAVAKMEVMDAKTIAAAEYIRRRPEHFALT